jgi:hypothetical protein
MKEIIMTIVSRRMAALFLWALLGGVSMANAESGSARDTEPNNIPSKASQFSPNAADRLSNRLVTEKASVRNPGDVDFFAFEVHIEGTIDVALVGGSSDTLKGMVRVFDAEGRLLGESQAGSGVLVKFVPGTYYARVSASQRGKTSGSYILEITGRDSNPSKDLTAAIAPAGPPAP